MPIQPLESANLRVITDNTGYMVDIIDAQGDSIGVVGSKTNPLTGEIEIPAVGDAGVDVPFAVNSSLGCKLLNFSTLAGLTITAGGTIELVDASVPDIGKLGKSVKITVPAGTTKSFNFSFASPLSNPAKSQILVFENQNIGLDATATWYAANDAGLTNHYFTSVSFNRYGLSVLNRANNGTINEWTVGGGSPDFETLTHGRLTIVANASNDCILILHGLYAASRQLPIVQIIQDDAVVSGYTALLPLLNFYGLKAGFSIIADIVGTGGYLNPEQLKELYMSGNDLLPHGMLALSSYSTASIATSDIKYNADYLTNNGYTRGRNVYVYPNGVLYFSATDRTTITNYLKNSGYDAAYVASGKTHSQAGSIGQFAIDRYPVNATVNTTTAINNLDMAIDSGRGMVFMLHAIVASGASGDASNLADVVTILSAIRDRVRAGKCIVLPPSRAARAHKSGWASGF